jgi:SAM-dependent methyltransferase
MGLNVVDFERWSTLTENQQQLDVFFSGHVLEHVPRPSAIIRSAFSLLKKGGIFISFMPNGSASHRGTNSRWNSLWGQVHPNLIDEVFLNIQLSSYPRLIGSHIDGLSGELIDSVLGSTLPIAGFGPLEGEEIFAIAKKI